MCDDNANFIVARLQTMSVNTHDLTTYDILDICDDNDETTLKSAMYSPDGALCD